MISRNLTIQNNSEDEFLDPHLDLLGVLDSSDTLQLMVTGKYSDAIRSFLVNLVSGTSAKSMSTLTVLRNLSASLALSWLLQKMSARGRDGLLFRSVGVGLFPENLTWWPEVVFHSESDNQLLFCCDSGTAGSVYPFRSCSTFSWKADDPFWVCKYLLAVLSSSRFLLMLLLTRRRERDKCRSELRRFWSSWRISLYRSALYSCWLRFLVVVVISEFVG